MRFRDKVCLVTGGGSGIGKAACLRLAAEGGRVVVVDINEDGKETVQEIDEGRRPGAVREDRRVGLGAGAGGDQGGRGPAGARST